MSTLGRDDCCIEGLPGRSSEAGEGLDGSGVRTVFQKMSGEAVPERMHSDVFLQSGPFGSPTAREVDHPSREGLLRSAGKQPSVGPGGFPVLSQQFQEPWREHDIPVLLAFSLHNTDQHPATVDMLNA